MRHVQGIYVFTIHLKNDEMEVHISQENLISKA